MLFVLRKIHYLQICSWNANFNKNYPYINYNYSGETLNELQEAHKRISQGVEN